MAVQGEAEAIVARLFASGERLGWEFRDRRPFFRPFREPEPEPSKLDVYDQNQLERSKAGIWMKAWVFGGSVAAGYVGVVGVLAISVNGGSPTLSHSLASFVLLVAWLVGIALLAGLVDWTQRALRGVREAKAAWVAARHERMAAGAAARYRWERRRKAHPGAEWARVDAIPEWGAVRTAAGTRRIHLFGGSLESWQGFCTTFGASMVGTSPPVLVLDLSQHMVAAELCQLAAQLGLPTHLQLLPEQAASTDLLSGLSPAQLADILVESLAEHDGQRSLRAADARILSALCDALAPDLSFARLHEGLLALIGEPVEPSHLSRSEWDAIANLFSYDYLRQALPRLRALEAQVHPLRELGSGPVLPAPSDAVLRTLMLGDSGRLLVTSDLLVHLLLQWLIRALQAASLRPNVLIVVGADQLPRRHLRQLTDLCTRLQVRSVLLFRELEGEAAQLLGSSDAVAFMRLANAHQAELAANHIGKGHYFQLTQLTRSHSETQSSSRGMTDQESFSRATPFGFNRGRSWGTTRGYAESIGWQDAESKQRVYEYAVEPTWLQHLPDFALLLVQRTDIDLDSSHRFGSRTPELRVADCNPDILSLPRVLTTPLDDATSSATLSPGRGRE